MNRLIRKSIVFIPRFIQQKQFRKALLLTTIRKSGSHYLMSLLANYVAFEYLSYKDRVDFKEMKQIIWNTKGSSEINILKKSTGYSKWIWQHENYWVKFNNSRQIIHTYRNPYDYITSMMFWKYENRVDKENRKISISRVIDDRLPQYICQYLTVREIENKPNVTRIAYEDLVLNPFQILEALLKKLELRVNTININKAIDASRRKRVKQDEEKYNVIGGNLVGNNMNVGFIRNGQIGEWKKYFSDEDYWRVRNTLEKYDIIESDFVMEV